MSMIVKAYPSKSKPGKEYHIIKAQDGSYYCDCWQWKRNRTCSHLESFMSGGTLGKWKNTSGSKCLINKETKKGSVEYSIDNIINNYFPR